MHRFLLLVLFASLAANAWLGYTRFTAREGIRSSRADATVRAEPSDPLSPATSASRLVPESAAARRPFVWTAPARQTNEDLRRFAAQLQAAGFPPEVIARCVQHLLRDSAQAQLLQFPFWEMNSGSREFRQRQQAAEREVATRLEEVLGPAGSALAMLHPLQREHVYGNLPDAKVAALFRINRDYDELIRETMFPPGASRTEPSDIAQRTEQLRALEKERYADLAAVKTPDELTAYELRNSAAAQRVMAGMRDITADEQEYAALVRAQKARDPNASATLHFSFDRAEQPEATANFVQQVRSVLGDDRAHLFLNASDQNYRLVAQFTATHPEITAVKTQQLYLLRVAAIAANRPDGTATAAAGNPPAQLQTLNTQLDALLGSAAAAEFRKTPAGAAFNARARPTAPAARAGS